MPVQKNRFLRFLPAIAFGLPTLVQFLKRLEWVSADTFCRDENMRLLSIETYEEDQLIYNQVKSISRNVLPVLADIKRAILDKYYYF
jgi:hypothetical protein